MSSLISALHSLLFKQQAANDEFSGVYGKAISDHPAINILKKTAQDRERRDEEEGNKDLLKSTNSEVLLPGQARELPPRRLRALCSAESAFTLRLAK